METSSWESTVEAPERKRPGVTLSTIEEEAYSRSGNDSPVDNALAYSQFFNSKALLSITWCMADIKECKRRGIPLESRVRSKLEGFKNFITTELAGCIVSEISTDDRSTSCTQVPEPKANDDLAVEPTVPSTSNYLSPTMITSESYTNVQSTPSNDLACDINMNVSAKLCTDDSTNTSAFPFASPKHENADDHVSNDVYKMKPTTNRSSPTIVSRYENSSIISSDHPVEEPTTMTVTPRMLFEKSLLQSANDFFRRMEITAKATPNLQSSNDELSCTNPFKKNIEKACKKHCSTSVTSHPSKNSLRRPHRATNAQIKNQPCEPSSTQIIYENGSVLYGLNVNLSIDNNSSRTMNESYANACEKRNVIDVQEWTGSTSSVSTGHSNVDNSKVVSPSLSRVEPPRVVNGNGDVPSLNAANWLKAIETAIDFKKEFITKQNNEIQNDPTSRLIENAITLNAKQHNEIKNNPTLRLMENATTQNDSSQLPNCWQIPLTSYTMHLIKHEGRGWLALHEFAAFINTSPKVIVESLSPENINESFCLIRRYDNIQLFEILDRSSLCVPRDRNNKIGHILDLMSLESVLQILRKLKLVTTEQIDKAKNGRICPDDSSLLRDVCILNAVSMECINLNAP